MLMITTAEEIAKLKKQLARCTDRIVHLEVRNGELEAVAEAGLRIHLEGVAPFSEWSRMEDALRAAGYLGGGE